MSGQKLLLLLTVFVHLAGCQQRPTVSMSPILKEIFTGDLFYLSCDDSVGRVKWFLNDKEQFGQTNKTWRIAVASPKHSGSYRCEHNGQKSDTFPIEVMEFSPVASLTISTGHPVMHSGHVVILQLHNEDGLKGWKCWVYRRAYKAKNIPFKLKGSNTAVIYSTLQKVPETIFWCTSITQYERSNQIIIRTSDRAVSLVMYPLPAVVGESLTLKCLVWGTDQVSDTVFYKDDNVLSDANSTVVIGNVTEETRGRYKCEATYTYSTGPPYNDTSDVQDVLVQAPPIKAVLAADNGLLTCSCPRCHSDFSHQWYYKGAGQPWESMAGTSRRMTPQSSGTYACRAVRNNRKSFLSNTYDYNGHSSPNLPLIIFCFLLTFAGALTGAAVCYKVYKKRHSQDSIYEDVALRFRDDGDRYVTMRKGGEEAEYDTPNRMEGDYEAGVYHTLGPEEAAGAQGVYESLEKVGMEEGVYDNLGEAKY